MPSPEVPLQRDLFTGEMVDNRTQHQKQADRNHGQPHQADLFSAREVAQFGVRARPLIPLASGTTLAPVREDPRTPEEQERDAQRAAEKQTHPLFAEPTAPVEAMATEEEVPLNELGLACLETLRRDARARQQSVEHYLHGLWEIWRTLRDEAIAARANRIWALHDEAVLHTEFERRAAAGGFSVEWADAEAGQEAWWAAWQLAIEDVEVHPPPLPTFSRASIKTWLESRQSAPSTPSK